MMNSIHRRRYLFGWLVALVLAATAGPLAVPDAAAAGLRAGPALAIPVAGVSAEALTSMFAGYGDTSGRWSGADGTVSVLLPDGRVAWLFSDTFVGSVNPDHTRPRTTPLINSSMVVQDGVGLVATLHGGTSAAPASLIRASQAGEFYWIGDAVVLDGTLQVLVNRYRRTGTGSLDVGLLGTALAVFALPGLTLQSVADLSLGGTVAWGAALVQSEGYTYVYGSEDTDSGQRFAHLARVTGGLSGPWQFWTGTGWSSTAVASVRLLSGVGTSFAAHRVNGGYVLVTQETGLLFHPWFVAYTAPSPTGPFAGPIPLFSAAEVQPGKPVVAYTARLHPELARSGKLLVSYDVNSLDIDDVYADARLYRPRFVEVDWPRPATDPTTMPAAPTELTGAVDQVTGGVHLSWRPPTESGLSYWLYQRDMTAGQTHVARHPANTTETSVDVGFLRSGHTYEFRVSAANETGEGPASTVAAITPQVAAPPAPTNVAAAADRTGAITVSWTAVPYVWNYEVYRRDITAGQTSFSLVTRVGSANTSLRMEWLDSGHLYEFYVMAYGAGGASPPTTPVRATAQHDVPAAPTNLTAVAGTDGTIALSWTGPAEPVWYLIYQRDITAGESSFTQLPLPVTSGTTMTAGYLMHAHEYEFAVAATNRGGESAKSNLARATARYPTPPAPTNLRATAGDGQAQLTWDSPTPGLWYLVYQRDVTEGETTYTQLPLPVTAGTTMTAGYLANGHTYEFKVTALSQAGEGPASNTDRVTPQISLPGRPVNLTATARADGTIALTWDAPAANLWYLVYQRDLTAGGDWQQLPLPVTEGAAMTAGYLTHAHTYEFKVAATNSAGEGPASTVARATSWYNPPAAPANLRGRSAGNGMIDLDWDARATNVFHWIYWRDVTAGETNFTKGIYPTDRTTASLGPFVHGHVYEFAVSAASQGGESPMSTPARVTSTGGLPSPPGNLTAAAGDGQATLRWTASPTANVLYTVYQRDVTAGQSWQQLPLPANCCTMTAGYLANGHVYEFKVAATNASGNGTASNVASARPLPPLPAAPTNLSATPGNGKATLRWTASSMPNVWYIIEYRPAGGTWQRLPHPVTSCCTFPVDYLWNGKTYEFRVRATNLAGESGPSNTASARPMPPFPQPPTNLTAMQASETSVRLTWSASPTPGVYYWVYYRQAGVAAWTRLPYPVTACCAMTAGYLAPLRRYEFAVAATNLAGNSAATNIASAFLAVAPPVQVGGLYATPLTSSSAIQLRWSPAAGATGYSVQARPCGWQNVWYVVGIMITGTSWTYRVSWAQCWEFSVYADRYGLAGRESFPRSAYSTADDYPYPDTATWKLDPWLFYVRQCTSFAAWRIRNHHVWNFDGYWRQPFMKHWWHAWNWDTAGDRAGIRRGSVPEVGSIAQWNDGEFGHVAFVAGVDGSDVIVEEYNGAASHAYSRRRIPWTGPNRTVDNFLHFEEL